MHPIMKRPPSILLLCLAAACGSFRPGAPIARPEPARAGAQAARAPAPAKAPEMDPANVEQRFGVAEARQREQTARQRREREGKRIEVEPVQEKK